MGDTMGIALPTVTGPHVHHGKILVLLMPTATAVAMATPPTAMSAARLVLSHLQAGLVIQTSPAPALYPAVGLVCV